MPILDVILAIRSRVVGADRGDHMARKGSSVEAYCDRCNKIREQVVISYRKAAELQNESTTQRVIGALQDAAKTSKLIGADYVQCKTCHTVNDM
ncbi:hypothetical protein [Streptomyces sp. NPDC003710]